MITHWKPHLKKMVTLNHLNITPSYHVQSLTDKICIVFIPRFVAEFKVIKRMIHTMNLRLMNLADYCMKKLQSWRSSLTTWQCPHQLQ